MTIHVLRLGHRRPRDARITTHVALTARALGADAFHLAEDDRDVESTVRDVVERFGGPFDITNAANWRRVVTDWKQRGGAVMHLTMYGQPLQGVVDEVRNRDVLLVVGAEKVPPDLYELADYNVGVGNQPHSEVAALAIALDRLTGGSWQGKNFRGRLRVVPNPFGKTLIERDSSSGSGSRGGPGVDANPPESQ